MYRNERMHAAVRQSHTCMPSSCRAISSRAALRVESKGESKCKARQEHVNMCQVGKCTQGTSKHFAKIKSAMAATPFYLPPPLASRQQAVPT